MTKRWLPAVPVAVALTLGAPALGACGEDDDGDPGSTSRARGGELTISAAASLTEAFTAYADRTPADERFSFAGSDDLAAQIRQGARPDLYAAANAELPEALADEGLVEPPVTFTANTLVIAVPKDSSIDAIDDLARPGTDLVIGSEGVPFGAYARTVLERLGASRREAILDNVRSEEPDVKAAVGKLVQGAADASFTYASDVAAAGDRLKAIALPSELEPDVAYAIAIVKGGENAAGARAFIDGLLSGAGAEALRDAGFKRAPGS